MGSGSVYAIRDAKTKHAFTKALLKDIAVLDMLIKGGAIEFSPLRIGAEQEFVICDAAFAPLGIGTSMLKQLADDQFTTEIGSYNLEANLHPVLLGGRCFSMMHEQNLQLIHKASAVAEGQHAKVVLTGILPTLEQKHTQLSYMTDIMRYHELNAAVFDQRKSHLKIHIQGVDEVTLLHESVMLEGCNTSFQIHLQVPADDFVAKLNWANAIAGPVLSASCNSPLLFGKELWHETRIALFTQSVDTRHDSHLLHDQQPRVSLGTRWHTGTVTDIFKDHITRFKSLLTCDHLDDSVETMTQGLPPKLGALCLHNGTVYRWNRPCYGITQGKPHLRIECRYVPAGPTIVDQVANMALWIGAMMGMPKEYANIHNWMDFRDVQGNFLAAARYGLDAPVKWDGKTWSARSFVGEMLMPWAKAGLKDAGVNADEIAKYLGIIERRLSSKNGAQWMIDNYRSLLKQHKRAAATRLLMEQMHHYQSADTPVSEWDDVTTANTISALTEVSHVMNTDIYSVEESDSLELARAIMQWKNIHHLPVIKNDQTLVGIISSTDFVDLNDHLNNPVSTIMNKKVISVDAKSDLNKAISLMKTHNIRALPVTVGNKLIGIVTSNDL